MDLLTANVADGSFSVILGNGAGTFAPQASYYTGHGPQSVTVGDFNADGKLDLAIGNSWDATISILLGKGDGTFLSNVEYATGTPCKFVVTQDFNRDGKLDIAVGNATDDSVSILIGNGDGSFQNRVDYATAGQPTSAIAVDLNRDGSPDLAVASLNSSTVSILLGNGDGTFRPRTDSAVAEPLSMATADFNRDAKPDLVTGNLQHSVSILLGNGDGTFLPHFEVGTCSSAYVATADFNRDHIPDIAVVSSSELAFVLLNLPVVGLFPSELSFGPQTLGTSSSPQSLLVSNPSGLPVRITNVVASGDFQQTNNCGVSLAPDASCTIKVVFKPTAEGTRSGQLTIADNATKGIPQVIKLVGSNPIYFPQIVVGGGYSTVVSLLNTGAIPASGSLLLTNQSGNPYPVTVDQAGAERHSTSSDASAPIVASSVPIAILPGGTRILTLTAVNEGDPAKSGWARVEGTWAALGGVAAFKLYDLGVLKTTAGVESSLPIESASIPVDNDDSQQRYTGYAIANPGNASMVVSLAVVDLNGTTVDDSTTITLGPGEQTARFLHQDLPARSTFRGSMVFRSQNGKSFAVVALLQYRGLLTVIPAIPGNVAKVPN
jgi:hypothetical protein